MKQRVTFEAWVDNQMSPEFSVIEKDGKRAFQRIDAELDDVNRSLGNTQRQMVSLNKVMGAAAGYIAIDRIVDWGSAIVQTTAKYQKFAAVLENSLGSKAGADAAFSQIQRFATTTPFQVDDLTDSFVRLTNQGFTPNMNQMRSLGDLASSTGKDYLQLTEAIIDAQTGEFERLKEFGIRASKNGDQVTFTFKNQKQTVDFTADSIRKYILSLGDAVGVSGSMAKIMETTGGKISNLNDNMDRLQKNIGERYRTVIDGSITRTSKFVSLLADWAEVPLSEKMQDEREKVNGLASELVNSNTSYEARLKIMSELQSIAPDVISGIDAERIATEKLRSQVEKYNQSMISQIAVQKMKEQVDSKEGRKLEQTKNRAAGLEYDIARRFNEAEELLIKQGRDKEATQLRRIRNSDMSIGARAKEAGYILNANGGLESNTGYSYSTGLQLLGSAYITEAPMLEKRRVLLEAAKQRVADWAKDLGVSNPFVESSDNSLTNGGGSGSGGSGSGGSGGVGSVIGGITGDNRTVKNININISKLGNIESMTFSGPEDEESINEFLDKLREGLMVVLNDTNTMVN